jgi:alkane 1-monooxygenase
MISAAALRSPAHALPFWLSLAIVPLVFVAAALGGWWFLLVPLAAWWLLGALDVAIGSYAVNADPLTPERDLKLYRMVTMLWVPVQIAMIFGLIWFVQTATTLGTWEKAGLFFAVGVLSGTVGITYAHELMHQKNRLERWLADILLASVLYSHFRSEHLLVHHRHVGTPADAVTARYNEGFHRFFPRVLRQSAVSAVRAEARMLARKDRPWWDPGNPFWRYAALQGLCLGAAFLLGGWGGVGLFVLQAFVAIWQLELINYIEHYGLTRKHLGDGRYERVQPHHSWNAAHRVSNWLLINLQRHSDHHVKPDRRYPLLQTYAEEVAPGLPHGYPLMSIAAMIPPLWKRIMNPRVKRWRAAHYPEITDWHPYNKALNPLPRP